jgi:hypothetical protein
MLKFLPGILLLQAVTVALVLIAPAASADWGWLRLVIPVLIVGLLTLTTAGGALVGYLLRIRQEKGKPLLPHTLPTTSQTVNTASSPPSLKKED